MPRARRVSHPTLGPLGQPEKAVGHESPIEPWLAPDNRVLLVGLRTDWLRRKDAMKIADRENQKRYATARSVPRLRNGRREHSCSMGRAGRQEKIRPQEKCFSLTPFIELLRSWQFSRELNDVRRLYANQLFLAWVGNSPNHRRSSGAPPHGVVADFGGNCWICAGCMS